jgi:2-succinyl-6-hydroxy-2,4-cyclohexadiene-1-carboxylate synthase
MTITPSLHTEEEGTGPTVVLVHGFTQTSRSWGPVGAGLAAGHRVVRVDAPGHGGSGGLSADLWTGARLLGQAGGPAAYVGYSMGGRLCLHLALLEPGSVRALVLIGATAGIDDPDERAARRASDEAWARRLETEGLDPFLEAWLAQPLFAGLGADAAGLAERRRNTVAGLADSLRRAGTGTQDPPLWDRLGELTMPVLAVAGEHDRKFRQLAERLTSAIGGNAAIAVVPGAGHAAHLEAPGAFLDVVRPFLAASA